MKRLIKNLLQVVYATGFVVVSCNVDASSAERFKGHMSLLADDLLAGRDTGSIGHDFASLYIASELTKLGIVPAGDDGSYYQIVPFKQATLDMASPTLSVSNGQQKIEFAFMDNMLMSANMNDTETQLTGELVFAGFGIDAPFLDYSDYGSVDLQGKIAVILSDRPHHFPSEEGSHFRRQVSNALVKHGAIGAIVLSTPVSESVFPFEKRKLYVKTPRTRWVDTKGGVFGGYPQLKAGATLSVDAGKQLFELAGLDLQRYFDQVENGEPITGQPLGLIATFSSKSNHSTTTSPNVIGMLEGSDPALKHEYIVLTAHSDHIGVSGHSVLKDKINNGAMDNASGVSTLLEIAHEITHSTIKPKRSVIFAFVTGEEKGLLGSEYFAHYPPVPIQNMVANVNLDMPILTYRTDEMIAYGATHSSLETPVRNALLKHEMKLIDDPMPEQAIFVRSDQYSLVKQGVPAVYLVPGMSNREENAIGIPASDFLKKHYHMPSDDLNLPIDYQWAAKFVDINFEIVMSLANMEETPHWNANSFFATFKQARDGKQ